MSEHYELINCEDANKSHPESFNLPPVELYAAIKIGSLVKLIFAHDGIASERMWVEVLDIANLATDGYFFGQLTNKPLCAAFGLSYGSLLVFKLENVCDIVNRSDGDVSTRLDLNEMAASLAHLATLWADELDHSEGAKTRLAIECISRAGDIVMDITR